MTEDPRMVALSAADTGARVLVMLDGENVEGHVAKLLHGGFVLVVKLPTGHVERHIWYAHVKSMAEFVDVDDDPEVDDVDDDLQELSRNLRMKALKERSKSLAERMISERES